jgi:signal transduction histidine kinase
MRFSIRWQLLAPLLLLLAGDVAVSVALAASAIDRARSRLEDRLRQIADVLGSGRFPLKEHVLEMTRGLSGIEFLVVGRDGERVSTLPTTAFPIPAESLAEIPRLGPVVEVHGRSYFCGGVPLKQGIDAGGTLYLLVPEALWDEAVREAVLPPLALGAFGGLAAMVLVFVVARRLSRRIGDLERHTRRIATGDFSPMPLPRGNDELRDLGQSVNEMAERLDRLQETVKQTERVRILGQVGGGLAHQLRNAVTGARLAVQLHVLETDGVIDVEPLQVALRQLDLVEANLKRFLDLGRPESRRREVRDLRSAIDDAVMLLRPRCRHSHIDLTWTPPADAVSVLGDSSQLQHLFLNLLDNAIDAAGPEGKVEIVLRREDEAAVVEILDSGPGPAAEVAPRLFEPFVTGKPEGVGLGLVVAKRVAETHGGTVSWRRREGRTCFRVALPALGAERDGTAVGGIPGSAETSAA